MKRTIKILKGKKMYATDFGLRNQVKGMYTGGFKRYLFGIKYIFGIEIEYAWGGFK
jgi:hypothetical protein|tara:strand:- start:338 stop:505 length:168 start_codon:yes stop_codon:yes gene_type:complete